jgi:hypothetical protein
MMPPPSITVKVKPSGEKKYVLRLTVNRFAKDVSITTARGEIDLSDNFFDLDPHAPREIAARTSLATRKLTEKLRITSMGEEIDLRQ